MLRGIVAVVGVEVAEMTTRNVAVESVDSAKAIIPSRARRAVTAVVTHVHAALRIFPMWTAMQPTRIAV